MNHSELKEKALENGKVRDAYYLIGKPIPMS